MMKRIPCSGSLALPALLCCLPLVGAAAERAPWLASSAHEFSARPTQVVSGRVTDDKGEGLPGVTVLVKGTTTGTSTGADGSFSLDVPDGATLIISSVGFVTQEIAVAGRTTINVTLATDNKQLNEVVVLGYVSQDRQNLSSAVSSVDVAEAKKAPVATVAEAIQGRTPGVNIQNSGTPGQAPNVVVRGAGTLYSGSNPLYVVDGTWTDNIRDLNPQDIAAVNILKDASSTAVYGSQGANGVIIITTRRGKPGKPTITVDASAGSQNVVGSWDLTNAAEWAALSRQAYENAGRTPIASAANPENYADTDWQKAVLRPGSVQNYNVGLSGGSSGDNYNSNYLVSGGYFNQKGTLIGTDFERYTLRLNSGITSGRFTLTESAQLSHTFATLPNGQPFQDAIRLLPTIPIYDPTVNSGYGIGSDAAYTFGTNPVAEQRHITTTQYNNRLQGSLAPQFRFTDWLYYKLNLSIDALDYTDRSFRRAGIISFNAPNEPGYLNENRGDNTLLLAENTLNFTKEFGENHINAVLGYSEQSRRLTNASGRANNYSAYGGQFFPILSLGAPVATQGGVNVFNKRSFFGQAVYDYKNRYLLTGSYRVDQSSVLDDKTSSFYAGSIGWRLSEESFFKNAAPFVSNLKPRFSYGVNGNDGLNNAYPSQSVINVNAAYVFNGNAITPGAIQTTIPSQGLKWERRYFTNYGLDLGLLDDRLTFSAEYYISRTENALIPIQLPIYLGSFNGQPYGNFGKVDNRGFELAAGYQDNRGVFTYGISGNLTTLRNRVLYTDASNSVTERGLTYTEVGEPIGAFYLIEFDGIFQTQEEVNNHTTADGKVIQPYARPGDVRYVDANGDGTISTSGDRVHLGSPVPTLTYGLNLNAGYKGFDLSVLLQGVAGNNIYNVARATMDRTDDPSNHRANFRPWTPENPSTTTPRALANNGATGDLQAASAQNSQPSSRFLEKGDYLRGKNFQLGYTFPKTLTDRVKGVGSVRLYVTGQNFFTATKYTGPDPEFTNNTDPFQRGVDFNSYPNLRTFSGGIQLGF